MNKTNVIIKIAIAAVAALLALSVYVIFQEITNPQPIKKQHGSYAHCEYRAAKGACGKWTTKTY